MTAEQANATDLDHEDEPYNSAEDEDFQLDDAQDDGEITSDDENETEPASKRRKRDTTDAGLDASAELDSGDEATIRKARSKKQKKQGGKKSKDDDGDDEDDVDIDDDEGGPGGFVRTRAMRMHMQEERKPLAKIDGATVDVDALWAKMNAMEEDSATPAVQAEEKDGNSGDQADTDTKQDTHSSKDPRAPTKYREETIKIKRTYKFAGEWITEEKVVPKDSAEAKIFLAEQNGTTAEGEESSHTVNLRRPLRKISRFDPNPTGSIKKSWEKQPATQEDKARGPKINTVEKSRLDWAAYVDEAGIKDELRVHSKAKEGFLGRMDFLDRVGANREEEARNARLKGL